MSAVRWNVVLWLCLYCGGTFAQTASQEVELFNSVKQASLKWTSYPNSKAWSEKLLKMGSETQVPVYQACAVNNKPSSRSLLTNWIARKDALHLLLDLQFAQEEESSSNQLSPLQVHLLESDSPLSKFSESQNPLNLKTSQTFSTTTEVHQIKEYLKNSLELVLNTEPLSHDGFHLGFTYSGRCIFLSSVRLYYRRCPPLVSHLVGFEGASAGAGSLTGSCVEGTVGVEGKLEPPQRECQVNGKWGPLQGGCTCAPGHQEKGDSCEACRVGYYKAANESGGCRSCPPNRKTDREGAEGCDCRQGYFSLPGDPYVMGCTRPPSAPVNVTVQRLNDSILTLLWDPPIDLGGRQEVMYDVECSEREGGTDGQWAVCGEAVIFLPASAGLTVTAVNLTWVSPWSDYRLSVRARNDVSFHQGAAAASSTAPIIIHRWKSLVINTPGPIPLDPHHSHVEGPSPWVIIGTVLGVLLLSIMVPAAVYSLRRKYTKLSQDQEVELLPSHTGVTYGRNEGSHAAPQEVNMVVVPGVVQLLESVGDKLLTSLRDVLVDRNQLTLGKELGAGEFGSVYEGIFTPEQGMDIKVAVKTMRVGLHRQEDLESFLKEAEIMQHFDHINVVKLLGVTLEQDSPLPVPLVILPFMKHGDLRRFLIATRYGDIPMFVPHQSLLRFMVDIAAGMEYLSSHGFLHRDLAARNCMLGDDLHVCVADFGLSKKTYSNNYYRQTVIIRMPVKWMAIESLSESIFTSKSDVWSFAVTMWEIVSRGRTPYPGVHNHELLELLNAGHRLKLPECDDKLYEVMLSCWHREPGHRPGFRELGETLKALLFELPPLEASQEAHYINQGLEAATHIPWVADGYDNPGFEEGAVGNVYLPTPVGAGANAKPPKKDEEGYLLCMKTSTVSTV
ncbi:tyrosine-protein kinase receptor TYRO3 [Salvelinus fontinalis]|uniref:tyrosine-protein kinase receptor TYRO3 n=1 Tax=Salvelinus fontinalis TaxID=8038 RepID=UPI002485B3FA|nr:tyrosine-protein kinase receptor TYRO3 [Salvelinus fontinalis]